MYGFKMYFRMGCTYACTILITCTDLIGRPVLIDLCMYVCIDIADKICSFRCCVRLAIIAHKSEIQ